MELNWWGAVNELIQFDTKSIQSISSFADAIRVLQRELRAGGSGHAAPVRRISQQHIPHQNLFRSTTIHWWASCWKNGSTISATTDKPNRACSTKSSTVRQGPIAIIVGDGVTYEIADEIRRCVGKDLKTTADHFLADLPSVTDNNMSRLYRSDGSWVAEKAERERYLKD